LKEIEIQLAATDEAKKLHEQEMNIMD